MGPLKARVYAAQRFRESILEERVAEYGGKLGPYSEYGWGEHKGREAW